jgi:hypothetical protein
LFPGQHINGDGLDLRQRSLLVDCGLLIGEGEPRAEDIRVEWSEAQEHFRQHKFAVVADMIHPYHVGALRHYFRWLVRSGHIALGDRQVNRRWWSHNDPVAALFHRQIVPVVSRIVGEPVKPSYVYLAAYESGSVLKRHRDRPQCEFSVTVCIDYTPEPVLETQWPIKLGTEEGDISVYQSLGDGVVYAGCRLTHFRDKLPEGHFSMSLLFHYVPLAFTGSLH